MTWPDVLAASLTVLVGSTLQGATGLGMGLLAAPILMLIDPRFVPGPILLLTLVLTTFLMRREGHAIDLQGLRWAVAGRITGTGGAAAVLAVAPAGPLAIVFGGAILLGVAMSLSGLRLRRSPVALVSVGVLSGLMGTIAAVGGPPMALLYQHAGGPRLRATLSGFFWIGTIVSLGMLMAIGRFGAHELRLTLIALPSLILGLAVSRWAAGVVDRGYTRPAVLVLSGVTATVVILRQLV